MPRQLPQKGSLEKHPLPRVLLDLWRSGFAGTLRLDRGSAETTVTWQRGAPVGSASSVSGDGIGATLLAEGEITPKQHAALTKHQEQRSVPEAAALLALKLLEPKALVEAMRAQTSMRLVDAFGWAQGSFAIEDPEPEASEADAFRVDPLRILQEGLALHWRPDRILGDLEGQLGRHAIPTERFDALAARLDPTPEAEAVRAAVDPARPFGASVCTSLEPGRLAAAWVLAECGALDFQDGPPSEATEEEASPAMDGAPVLDIEIEVRRTAARDASTVPEEDRSQLELPSAEAEDLRKEVLDLHERLDELDHYEVLGVPADAPDPAIKKAYFGCAKRFHPDAVSRLGLSVIHREANELFARIAQAYQTLSNPARRQAYDRRSEDDGTATADAARVAQAETLYRKGEVLIKVGNFSGALDFLRPCVEIWPEEADYQGGLGWALYKKKPSDPETAREHLEKANELRADDPLLLFRLGMVLRRLGEQQAGQELLDRAKALEKQAKG